MNSGMRRPHPIPRADGGYALVTVLLVLLSLLVLCTPFLWTASHTDRTSARLVSDATTRIALDTGARHARYRLGLSHPALDATRFYDTAEELAPRGGEAAHLLDAAATDGVMWGHTVEDLSGRVDLNSAPPQLLANLLGQGGYLTKPLGANERELELGGARDLRPTGLLWIDGELIHYAASDGKRLEGLTRGLLGVQGPCGPRVASSHGAGEPIMGYDGWGLALWRISRGMTDARGLSIGDVVAEVAGFIPAALAGGGAAAGDPDVEALLRDRVLADMTAALERTTTLHGGVAAGRRWQNPVRLLNDVIGGVDCRLILADGRWVNAGTTVMVRQGATSELALVRSAGGGAAILTEPLAGNYDGGRAEVLVLARRPVNVNTASPDVLRALFENLKLRGVNERITRSEAEELAARVVLARPFEGFQDLLERLLLPAAGIASYGVTQPVVEAATDERREAALEAMFAARAEAAALYGPPFLTVEDAQAVYKNAVCATDVALDFATAPLAFTSRDTYALELRAAVNAASGVQRLAGQRRQLEWIAPQTDLLRLWTYQEDFDEALRLSRAAPGWGTGPEPTTLHDTDFGSTPPPRARVNFRVGEVSVEDEGSFAFARGVFASREEGGFAKPWHVRLDEEGPRAGRVVHFDLDDTALEGHDLSEEPWTASAASQDLLEDGLLKPFDVSFWIQPQGVTTGRLLDLAGNSPDGDRVTLFVEEESNDLVLRAIDGPGDHPDTAFEEFGEVRLELGDDGALPADVWSHVEASVRGTRPDQLLLRVDGYARARTPGLTRLVSPLGPDDVLIQVDSTEGFPPVGPVRIGDEVLEVTVVDEDTLRAEFTDTGALAGFGGRLARELTAPQEDGTYLSEGLFKNTSFEAGTPVQVYGYSAPIVSNVPAGGLTLRQDVGAFTAGRVVGLEGESNPKGDLLSAEIEMTLVGGGFATGELQFGRGIDTADTEATGLILEPVDGGVSSGELMSAFNADGGYAAVMQRYWLATFADDNIEDPDLLELQGTNTPLGGLEIVRYSGVNGNVLQIPPGGYGVDAAELQRLGDGPVDFLGPIGGNRAFVIEWILELSAPGVVGIGYDQLSDTFNGSVEWQTIVVPISLGVTGSVTSLLEPTADRSEFVQITEVGEEAGATEWVRYDEVVPFGNGFELVRDAPQGLFELFSMATNQIDVVEQRLGGELGGVGGGPSPPPSMALPPGAPPPPARAVPPPAAGASSAAQIGVGPYWAPEAGGNEAPEVEGGLAYTAAVRSAYQFRGVLGTWSHPHTTGADIVPVFRVFDRRSVPGEVDALQHVQPSWGWPGAGDAVFLVDEDPQDIGSPGVVQRAVRPTGYLQHNWEPGPQLTVAAEPAETRGDTGFVVGAIHVALREPLGVFGAPSGGFGPGSDPLQADALDARTVSRLVKFPSGELPRAVTDLVLGGDVAQAEAPMPALVDEFFRRPTAVHAGGGQRGASYILEGALSAQDDALTLSTERLRTPRGDVPASSIFGDGSGFDSDAGLLRIGSELIAYTDLSSAGSLILSVDGLGRGLLGTEAQAHAPGEAVHFLDHVTVTNLQSGLDADDGLLVVDDTSGFPREGTVLVGSELIHHTGKRDGLEMPARSEEPGAQDGKGPGLFRGRFGTEAQTHPNSAPVIHFQTRYWDRYARRADAPELHYFGFELPQPDAWVRSILVDHTDPALGGVRVGLLVRTDPSAPWDGEPGETPGLELRWLDELVGRPAPVAAQSSQTEWRLFLEYDQGAFDPLGGTHAWKGVPSIEQVAVDYIAPGRVFERSDG